MLSLIAGALGVQAVIYTRLSTHWAAARNPDAAAAVAHEAEPVARAAFPRRPVRPVYKLSVIPGGAYSADELRQALDSDEVAARHYAVFQRASLRTEPSRFAQPVYVSYRVGDAVFWTRRPVALAPHEMLLTDGTNFARARCGNRVAVTPQSPVEAASPAPGAFEQTEASAAEAGAANRDEPLLVAEVFPELSPETEWLIAGLTPEAQPTPGEKPIDQYTIPELPAVAVFPPLGCSSAATPPDGLGDTPWSEPGCTALDWLHFRPAESTPEPPPPTPIPEPGSLLLAAGALGAAAAVRCLAWRKRRPGGAPGSAL